MTERWRSYKTYLIERYGQPVYRIGVDGGFTCPNRNAGRTGGCIYCDAKGSSAAYQRKQESGYTRKSAFVENIDDVADDFAPLALEERKASLTKQIARGTKFLDERYPGSARSIYFQAFTNTYDSLDVLQALYDHALSTGDYRELIISTRPDCLDNKVVELLASYKDRVDAVWVELGLQSGNDETLRWIGRGHTVEGYRDATERLHAAGLEVCTHVILGFPFEKESHILKTADVIASTKVEALKIHNLHVVAGTRLYEMYRESRFHISTRAEHLANTVLLLRHIPSNIVIQRFTSDTPSHRLAAPRDFGDKNIFLSELRTHMDLLDITQGDLS